MDSTVVMIFGGAIGLFFLIILLIVLRKVALWYWGVDEIIELLKEIKKNTTK